MEMSFSFCREALERGRPLVLVTILTKDGSSPRGPGAKMAVCDGVLSGTIGGGALELRAAELAAEAAASGCAAVIQMDMSGQEIDSVDMVCGGRVTLLIEPCFPQNGEETDYFRRLERYAAEGIASTALTAVEPDGSTVRTAHAVRLADGILKGDLPAWAVSRPVDTSVSYRLDRTSDTRWLLSESVCPPLHLYICGGGHVGLKTAELAAFWGQSVTVIDDRPEFVSAERFPHAERVVCADYEQVFSGRTFGRRDCIIILTRGHRYDTVVLRQALDTGAGYIGMIGSRKKIEMAFATLRSEGRSEETIRRIHSPIGLPIHAETPAEIAVSIIAEIISETHLPNAAGTHGSSTTGV